MPMRMLPCEQNGLLPATTTARSGGRFAALRGERRTVIVLALVAIAWAIAAGVFLSHTPKAPQISYPASPSEPLFDEETGLNRYIAGVPPVYSPVDSRGLRRAHLALLVSLAGIAVAGYALRNLWGHRFARIVFVAAAIIVAAVVSLAPDACVLLAQQTTLAQRLGGVFGLAILCMLVRFRKKKLVQWPAFAICAGVIVLFALPLGRLTLVYTADWDLTEIRMEHWLYVVSHADRLLHGSQLQHQATPSYGQLTTLVNVALQKLLGEFTMRGHLAFIVGLQTVVMLSLLRTYYVLSRGVWLLCVPALILAGCNFWLVTWMQPNHSAWRYFFLWLIPWTLTRLAAAPVPHAAFGAGLLACLAIVHNVETGVAAAAGCFAFIAYRSRHLTGRQILATAAATGFGCAGGLLCWVVLCVLSLGGAPDLGAAVKQAAFFRLMSSSGFSAAVPIAIDPLALVILGSCCYTIVYRLLDWRRCQMRVHGVQFAVAATMLVWFAYYANRPHREYLYGFFPLLGCLCIDQLRLVSVCLRGRLPVTALACAAAATGWVLAPIVKQQCKQQYLAAPFAADIVRSQPEKYIPELGAYLPDDARTAAILQKAEYLKSRDAPELVFLTVDCYPIAKLSRAWPKLPVTDIFWECLHARQFDAAWSALNGGLVEEILFDPRDWLTLSACHNPVCASERRYIFAVRERIAQEFEFVGAEAGWERWRRRKR